MTHSISKDTYTTTDMPKANKASTNAMIFKCLLALGLLAALAVAAYLILDGQLKQSKLRNAFFKISGQQRALSRETTQLAHNLVDATDPGQRTALRKKLLESIPRLEELQQALKRNRPAFFDPPANADSQARDYLASLKALAQAPDTELTRSNLHLQSIDQLTSARRSRGESNELRERQDRQNEATLDRLQRLNRWVLGATLFVLLLTALVVFRPMLRRLQQEMAELKALNETLEQRVAERSAAAEQRAQELARSQEELKALNETLEQRVAERSAAAEQRAQELARSQQALQQQLARITLLNQITRAIAQRQDLDSLFRVILQYVEDYLPVDFDAVYFCQPSDASLTTIACGPKSQLTAVELGMAEKTVVAVDQAGLQACLRGETVYVPDTAQAQAPILQKLAQHGFRSVLAAPLMADEKPFGILMVAQQAADGLGGTEGEFLRTLSEHVALATNHARLHTDLQQAYNELRQTQQAVMQQERLRALGQMASGIAHDVNNILSAVVGYSDLLLATEPDLSARTRRYLDSIRLAGQDITQMVARMREFYRRRDEQDELNPVALNSLVKQVIDLTRPRWRDIPQERGITIIVQAKLQDHLPSMMGVESEIREALTNLILNAVDAMSQGGTITIRTRWESRIPKEPDTPTDLFLEIEDTGAGMDEETKARCLEPFFSTKGELGTGLGLAMVYGVVQRHGGDIEVDSQPGKGTTVRLIFPIGEDHSFAASRASDKDQGPITARHILVIDDERSVRELVKEILVSDGHRVEIADSGQGGLDAFRAAKTRGEPFDVVVTDLGIPYIDGRQIARTVKHESPNTPVIMLTGWGTRLRAEGNIPKEVDIVLSKPPKIGDVRQALAMVTTDLLVDRIS